MNGFDKEIFLEQLRELYEGVPSGSPSWIITGGPDTGILGSVDALSAQQASATPCGSLTVAAHTEHLRWSLEYALAFYRGEIPSPDWSESWSVNRVDEDGWRQLRGRLRSSYEAVVEAVSRQQEWSDYGLRAGTLAIVSHGAYHLGAIRALHKLLREGSQQGDRDAE